MSRVPGRFVILFCVGALASACASAPRAVVHRDFPTADAATNARTLDAWQKALERADSQPPSRLLYDVHYSKGAVKSSGTLAVVAGSQNLSATVSGPFGSAIGDYRNGAFHLQNQDPFQIDSALLRAVLAGVWKGATPDVAGSDGNESLLRWQGADGLLVEAVLDLSNAHLRSLTARDARGELSVAFPGQFSPWPAVIEVVSVKTGQALRLKQESVEPIGK